MSEILSNKDLDSEAWAKLKAHYSARKQSLLEKLAGDLTPEETAKLRGRIQECKDFLRLEERKTEDTVHKEF